MAGEPTVTPGVYGPPPQQAQSVDPLHIVSTIMQLKQQKQQGAQNALAQMMQLAQQGIGDPKAMEKAFKEAYPGATLENPVPDHASAPQGGSVQQVTSAAASLGGMPGGQQSAFPVTPDAATKSPAGGQTPDISMSGQGGTGQFENFLSTTRRMAQERNLNASQEASFNRIFMQQKIQSMGDPNDPATQRATGFLQKYGAIPPTNIQSEMWNDPIHGDQYRQATLTRALGGETVDEKAVRDNRMAEDATMAGKFNSIADAKRFIAGDTTIKANTSPEDYLKQTEAFTLLINAGVPVQAARDAAGRAKIGANPFDALPPDFKSYAQQQMDLENKKVGLQEQGLGLQGQQLKLEQKRVDLEQEAAKAAGTRLLMEVNRMGDEKIKNDLNWFIDAKSKGQDVPQGMQEVIENELAKTMGMKVTEDSMPYIRTALHYLSLGYVAPHHYSVVPTGPSAATTGIVGAGIGGPPPGSPPAAGSSAGAQPPVQTPQGAANASPSVNDVIGSNPAVKNITGPAKAFASAWAHPAKTTSDFMSKLKEFMTLSPAEKQRIIDSDSKK